MKLLLHTCSSLFVEYYWDAPWSSTKSSRYYQLSVDLCSCCPYEYWASYTVPSHCILDNEQHHRLWRRIENYSSTDKSIWKKGIPWGLRRAGLVVTSSSSISELGTAISTTSSESEDALNFFEGDFGGLVGKQGLREFEGPATLSNTRSTLDVCSGLLFRFLGVAWATLMRCFTSCKTDGLLTCKYCEIIAWMYLLTLLYSRQISPLLWQGWVSDDPRWLLFDKLGIPVWLLVVVEYTNEQTFASE